MDIVRNLEEQYFSSLTAKSRVIFYAQRQKGCETSTEDVRTSVRALSCMCQTCVVQGTGPLHNLHMGAPSYGAPLTHKL